MVRIGILFHDGPRNGTTTHLPVSPNHVFIYVPADPGSGQLINSMAERYEPTGRTERRGDEVFFVFKYDPNED